MLSMNTGEHTLKVINLFGGPGIGKSTIAADVFAALKRQQKSAELVFEYAKTRVYEEHNSIFADQAYVFAKMLRQLHRLEGKVEYAVCDSPLLLSVIYAREHNYRYKTFEGFVFETVEHFNNLNILLQRTVNFDPNGRVHTLEQSVDIDKQCEELLLEASQPYMCLPVDPNITDSIIRSVDAFDRSLA